MSCILNIETSTSVCSVAISEDGMVPFVEEDLKGPSHAVSLGVFVDEALHRTPDRGFDGEGNLLRTQHSVDRDSDA